jgi:hypothetical protein
VDIVCTADANPILPEMFSWERLVRKQPPVNGGGAGGCGFLIVNNLGVGVTPLWSCVTMCNC